MHAQQNNLTYHIAFAASHNYIPYVAVAIQSIIQHAQTSESAEEHWVFHLITDKQDNIKQKGLQEILRTYPQVTIELHCIDAEKYKRFDHQIFSFWTTLRAELPLLLEKVDRLLYLDVDVLIVGDIRHLFSIDMKGYPLAMVEELFLKGRTDLVLPTYKTLPHYNAGILLMNLTLLREDNFTKRFWEYLERNYEMLKSPDQDAINILYKDRILPLPQAYNVMPFTLLRSSTYTADNKAELKQCLYSPIIIHYQRTAPWQREGFKHPFHQRWIDFNQSLKVSAPLSYEARGWKRFKVWLKTLLYPNSLPKPVPLQQLQQQWEDIPNS